MPRLVSDAGDAGDGREQPGVGDVLTVEVPKSLVASVWSGARFVRLSASGNNLLMITPYRGVDPEVLDHGSRNIRIGFDDIGPYPPARTFWLSVDVGF